MRDLIFGWIAANDATYILSICERGGRGLLIILRSRLLLGLSSGLASILLVLYGLKLLNIMLTEEHRWSDCSVVS